MTTDPQSKFPSWLITLAILAVVGIILVSLQDLLTLVAISYALAYLMDKAITYFEKFKFPRWVAFCVVCLALIILITVLCVVVLPPLIGQVGELVARIPNIAQNYSLKAQKILDGFSPGASQKYFSQKALLSFVDPTLIQGFLERLLQAVLTGYNLTLAILNIILLPIIVFYLAVDFRQIHHSFLQLFKPKIRRDINRVGQKINAAVTGYLQAQVVVALLLAVLYSFGFAIVGVPLWLAVGVITGLLNIVPYLGTITGITLSCGLLLVDGASAHSYWALLIVFTVAQLLEGNVITPKIVGERVGLSPLVVLLAILAFGKLFGLLGVIIAVPATAALKVLAREYLQYRKQQEAENVA